MRKVLNFKRLGHIPATAVIGLVKAYSYLISPLLGDNCRFYPTCSRYAIEAISTYGVLKGSYLALRRLLRCQPWCEGGVDPVPVYKDFR